MKKLLTSFATLALIMLVYGYIWRLLSAWNTIPAWRLIVSILCFILSIFLFIALLISLHISNFAELLSGFKFELLQIALISSLLAFVIITV